MKYLSIAFLLVASCTKQESKTCVCRDYSNSQEEVQRIEGMDGNACATRQIEWMRINDDVICNLE